MHSDSQYRDKYNEFIREYEELKHMCRVPENELESVPTYYLLHHGVLREQSSTTKLRVIFNASSPTETGISLNDILYPGRKLQNEISDVLLWFRLQRYVFSTDIVKMYRQIKIHPEDQNLQRIFWKTPSQDIITFRLTTVTYGLNCSPYLALRTVQKLIEDEGSRFPLAIPALSRGRYVDDIFGGADTINETKLIVDQLTQLCGAGGFPLQKWRSNAPELFSNPIEQNSQSVILGETEEFQTKILGITWHSRHDVFQYITYPEKSKVITKRSILSEISQLFDPLGFLSPVLINAKMLIQNLWLLKVTWDDTLPVEIENQWIVFQEQLTELSSIKIPRWLNVSSSTQTVEMHGFSDASNLAIAAVVYLRVVDSLGEIKVSLVQAKTKVAPLKRVTIPRLKLNAAFLVSRLVAKLQHSVNCKINSIFLWRFVGYAYLANDTSISMERLCTKPRI